jgi:hypothetical protein
MNTLFLSIFSNFFEKIHLLIIEQFHFLVTRDYILFTITLASSVEADTQTNI